MVAIMVEQNPQFELSRVEMERPSPQYMVDTLIELGRRRPGEALVLLLGGDSLRDLPSWGRPQLLIEKCTLGVMRRPGAEPRLAELERVLPGISARTEFFDAPLMEVSSSEIRRRAHAGESFEGLLLPRVAAIIARERLYLANAGGALPG